MVGHTTDRKDYQRGRQLGGKTNVCTDRQQREKTDMDEKATLGRQMDRQVDRCTN
jgi:hypothetical protein